MPTKITIEIKKKANLSSNVFDSPTERFNSAKRNSLSGVESSLYDYDSKITEKDDCTIEIEIKDALPQEEIEEIKDDLMGSFCENCNGRKPYYPEYENIGINSYLIK